MTKNAVSPAVHPRTGVHPLLSRWPAALGLAAAVISLVTVGDSESLAIAVSVAAFCYLAAAALGRPWVAWAAIPVATVVVIACKVLGLGWWVGLGVAAVILVGLGLVLRVPRPALAGQAGALVAFGGLAVCSLFVAPQIGLVVAGLALATHAVWDAFHLRRKLVVAPSMAEACIFLDIPLGLGFILLALVG